MGEVVMEKYKNNFKKTYTLSILKPSEMIKYTFFIWSILLFTESKAQSSIPSKSATEEWIKQTLANYPSIYFNGGTHMNENMKVMVSFSNCNMTITEEVSFGEKEITIIPISEIYVPQYTERPVKAWADNVALIFRVKNEAYIKSYHGYASGGITETKYPTEYCLLLTKSSVSENIPQRLINAFKNLIKYCGGSVSSDTY
jgi:hypothetical protein